MVIFFYELAQLFKTDGCILTVLDKTRMLLHRMHPNALVDVVVINIDASTQFLSTMSAHTVYVDHDDDDDVAAVDGGESTKVNAASTWHSRKYIDFDMFMANYDIL